METKFLIEGAKGKGGGGSPRSAQESPNTLQSKTTAKMLDLLGEGEIKGLVDGAKSIFLDETPLQNKNGSYNFEGFKWELRTGKANQGHMGGFSEVESEYAINKEVTTTQPITQTIDDPSADAAKVTIRVPALYSQDTTNGDIAPSNVTVAIYLSSNNGAFVKVLEDRINGKCMSDYQRQYRIKLTGAAPWQVRVTRVTPDSTLVSEANKTFFNSLTRISEAKLSYPDTSYIGLQVDAELFGNNVPARAYEVYGRYIKIPSNYNPVTRLYSGIWDGTFKIDYSNNPAWCLYDLLNNGRFGLGREIPETFIDKFSFYEIGQYCDEKIPDGRGGQSPRFTFNAALFTKEDALNFLVTFAGAFRSIIYYAMGSIFLSQDKPANYKRLLTPANVIDGEFNYSGTSLESRHAVALISWLDPNDAYKQAVEVVEDPEAIRISGWKTTDVIAFGCTNQGQAWRYGEMLLDIERNQTELISFSTGLDCADIMPGDVVAISDPKYAGVRTGGRLAAVSENSFTLDASFNFSNLEKYRINVITADNQIYNYKLLTQEGETNRVTLKTPIASNAVPMVGSVYILEANNLYPRLFRVMNIEEDEGLTINFSGYIYDENRYDRVEKNINLPEKPTSALPEGMLQVPYNFKHKEYLYLENGVTIRSGLTLSWAHTDPRKLGFEIEWKSPGYDFYEGKIFSSSATVDINTKQQGSYSFRVRAVDNFGRSSAWGKVDIYLNALYQPPADIKIFLQRITNNNLVLSWDSNYINQPENLLLSHFELRYSPLINNLATWEEATVIRANVSKYTNELILPIQKGSYFIKGVSIKNAYSKKEAVIINEVNNDFLTFNVVLENEQTPKWLGCKENTKTYYNNLVLTKEDDNTFCRQGYYYFNPLYFDLGEVYGSRILSSLLVSSYSDNYDVFSFPDMFALDDAFAPSGSSSWQAIVEYAVTKESPHKSTEDLFSLPDVCKVPDIFLSDLSLFGEWQPLIEPINVEARAYRFRINMKSLDGAFSPLVQKAKIIIDMPDRMEAGDDIEAGLGHLYRNVFNVPFFNVPSIVLTIQNAQQGDYYDVVDKTPFGFTVNIYDKNSKPTLRTIDWLAKGYGVRNRNLYARNAKT